MRKGNTLWEKGKNYSHQKDSTGIVLWTQYLVLLPILSCLTCFWLFAEFPIAVGPQCYTHCKLDNEGSSFENLAPSTQSVQKQELPPPPPPFAQTSGESRRTRGTHPTLLAGHPGWNKNTKNVFKYQSREKYQCFCMYAKDWKNV